MHPAQPGFNGPTDASNIQSAMSEHRPPGMETKDSTSTKHATDKQMQDATIDVVSASEVIELSSSKEANADSQPKITHNASHDVVGTDELAMTTGDNNIPTQDASEKKLTTAASENAGVGKPFLAGEPLDGEQDHAGPANEACRHFIDELQPLHRPSALEPSDEEQLPQHNQKVSISIASTARTKPRTWDESYQLLEAYKLENGDCNVPKRYPGDPCLGRWVSKIRSQHKRGKLGKERTEKLRALGFDWNDRHKARVDRQWQEQMNRLMRYKKEHGNCLVPQSYPDLGNWVSKQRVKYHRGKLDHDHKRALDEVAFVWEIEDPAQKDTSIFDDQWKMKYDELVAFHAKQGHWTLSTKENKPLARWASNQRTNYKRNQMPDWRMKMLEEIGFPWVVLPEDQQGLSTFAADDDTVSDGERRDLEKTKTTNDDGGLGVARHNAGGRSISMDEESKGADHGEMGEAKAKLVGGAESVSRQVRLDRLWEDKLSLLLAYKSEHGDCLVPQPYWNDTTLSTWVSKQRSKRKNGKLSPDRQSKLEDIGFVWEIQQSEHRECERLTRLWESQYTLLAAIHKDTGACAPPRSNAALVRWVQQQRKLKRNGKLRDDRKKLLDKLNFVWTVDRGATSTGSSTRQDRKRSDRRGQGSTTGRGVRGIDTKASSVPAEAAKASNKERNGAKENPAVVRAATRASKRRRMWV